MSYKDFIKNAIHTDKEPIKDSYVEDKPKNDWDIDTVKEIIKPSYSDNQKDYNVSVRDIVAGINNSKHKLSGANV